MSYTTNVSSSNFSSPSHRLLYKSVLKSSAQRNTSPTNYLLSSDKKVYPASNNSRLIEKSQPHLSKATARSSVVEKNLTSDSGLGHTYFSSGTNTLGSGISEVSQLSPSLPIYSWEQDSVGGKMPIPSRRNAGSLDRLCRSAFDLDIPDMRNARAGRERNRKDLHELNEKLAEQLERMRYLTSHNRQLNEEILTLKSRWINETERMNAVYEGEMRQLRQLLDDAEREKADSLSKLLSMQQTNRNQSEQIQNKQKETEKLERKLEQIFDNLNKREGDLTTLQRRLDSLQEEHDKERKVNDKLKRENDNLCQHLDEETANRMSGQSEMQTLKEEIEFLRRVHQDELKEMHRALNEVSSGFDQEEWQLEMAQAIRDIQSRYDVQLEKLRTEMEDMYNCRLRELAKGNPNQKNELCNLKSENCKLRDNCDNLRDQISQLQSKNCYLENAMQDVSKEAAELRRRIDFELAEASKERECAEESLANAHNEMAALLDVKLNLEAEIDAYRRLLETQNGLIVEASGKSSPDTRYVNDHHIRSRISTFSPQRRSDDFNTSVSLTDIHKPTYVRKCNSAHRITERGDPSGSSIRSRFVEVDNEGDQQLSCSYKIDQKNLRAELTAKTQFDKSYKGAVSIDECSPDGRYIVITNNGKNIENLNGWRIVRNIEHGKQIIRYTFPDTQLLPKSSKKIWARGQKSNEAAIRDLESPYATWGVGSYIYTTLFTMNGEERATHAQRSEFNVN